MHTKPNKYPICLHLAPTKIDVIVLLSKKPKPLI